MHLRQAVRPLLATLLFTAATHVSATAQASPNDATSEINILHQSEALEARGDIAGAEALVRGTLQRSPTSLSSLITLDRLLTMQGKSAEIEPFIDRLLQADPRSVIGHQMRVRLYSTLNRVPDLLKAGDAWIAAMPDVETPYREVARALLLRGDLNNAASILDRGRKRLGGNALALELGDVYAELRDYNRAVTEWGRNIGRDGQGFLPVLRRIQSLPDGGAGSIPALVASLRKDPTTADRKRAAAVIALDAGMVDEAETVAREAYRDSPAAERITFITDIARRADDIDSPEARRLAYWAYGEAVRIDTDSTRMFGLRTRYAQIALAIGDTAKASKLYADLEHAAVPGSPQRRQALAARIQLASARGDITAAAADLATFRAEFAGSIDVDDVASAVANAFLDRGDLDAADSAVAGIRGPMSGVARGRIALRRGDLTRASDEIISAAPYLHGAEATEVLSLATLIARMSKDGGDVLARSLAHSGEPARAIDVLLKDSQKLPPSERAEILDYAARMADRASLPQRAEQARREIITQYPQSPVAPAALLALAHALEQNNASRDDARLFFERIILEYPKSALVPQARRDLDRLLGRVPGG